MTRTVEHHYLCCLYCKGFGATPAILLRCVLAHMGRMVVSAALILVQVGTVIVLLDTSDLFVQFVRPLFIKQAELARHAYRQEGGSRQALRLYLL